MSAFAENGPVFVSFFFSAPFRRDGGQASGRRDRSNLPQRDQTLMELVLFWADLAGPAGAAWQRAAVLRKSDPATPGREERER